MGIAKLRLQRGDVVLTPFPFTDMSGARVRPALIVSADTSKTDVILAFISSIIPTGTPSATEYVLNVSDADFAVTGLKQTSIFKMDKLMTLEQTRIMRKLGRVSTVLQQNLDARLRIALRL
jgi:mRNA interferase MazF